MPLARAASSTSFMAGAISPTRSVASGQWCWSHISHTTTAVRAASQVTVPSWGVAAERLVDPVRQRVCRVMDSAWALQWQRATAR